MNTHRSIMIVISLVLLIAIGLPAQTESIVTKESLQNRMISDLLTSEISELSQTAWLFYGLNPISLRLLYFGIKNDPGSVELMQNLADLWVEDYMPPALLIYAYMMSPDISMSEDQEDKFDMMFASAMSLWGLSTRKDGATTSQLGDFSEGRKLFDYDMDTFNKIVDQEIRNSGSLKASFQMAVRFSGLAGGCVAHKTKGQEIGEGDIYDAEMFIETSDYQDWLRLPASELETLVVNN